MEEAPKGKSYRTLNFSPVVEIMEDEPVKINILMQKALSNPGELQALYEFSAFYDPNTKIMHTNQQHSIRSLCPFRDRHIGGVVCEVCGEIEKVKEKTVYLDGFGYLYWGNEKLGFCSPIFKSGGLLNTAKDEMTMKFRKIEEEGGKVTIGTALRVYEKLPNNYK